MFSCNKANGQESKTTRMFRPVRQVAAPGVTSTISDCILFYYQREQQMLRTGNVILYFFSISYITCLDDNDICLEKWLTRPLKNVILSGIQAIC